MLIENKHIFASLSIRGGKKDNFSLCLFEYFPVAKKTFFKSLLELTELGKDIQGDQALKKWVRESECERLIVDFPLSLPACHTCLLTCPGKENCPLETISEIRKEIDELIEGDEESFLNNPKDYERKREKEKRQEVVSPPLLSRAFKRKLKKGFLPYWNRGIDFWTWKNYYDEMLQHFNIAYDSFGPSSFMALSRFNYLKRHFPPHMAIHEASTATILLELIRVNILSAADLALLNDIEKIPFGRLSIVSKIEKHLGLFIYSKDKDRLAVDPHAFQSFLLGTAGRAYYLGEAHPLPSYTLPGETNFIAPYFSASDSLVLGGADASGSTGD